MDRNDLSQAGTVSNIPYLIDKEMLRELISKMKSVNAAGLSCVVSEMVKVAGEAGVDMITNALKQTILQGVIPAEWEFSTIVN